MKKYKFDARGRIKFDSPKEEAAFNKLAGELLDWIEKALVRDPKSPVWTIVCSFAVGRLVEVGMSKKNFMREMEIAFDREISINDTRTRN